MPFMEIKTIPRKMVLYGGYPVIKRNLSEGDIITCMDMHVNPIIKQLVTVNNEDVVLSHI